MNLAEFVEQEKEDRNLFWRLSSGDHQNLLDQALERIEELENSGSVSSGAAIIRWRDAAFKELEKERQDVLNLQYPNDYKKGILEGLRLAKIIIKVVSDDAYFQKAT